MLYAGIDRAGAKPIQLMRWTHAGKPGWFTADGRQVLNVMLTSRDPRISLERRVREEEGTFSGEDVYWYRLDLGGRDMPGMQSRHITVVELDNDRYAQVWINAESPEELGTLIALTEQLDVRATSAQLSAGN